MKTLKYFLSLFLIVLVVLISYTAFAGKLYIKPDLELKRAARLIKEADTEFRSGKIHIALSPEIAIREFEVSMEKYEQVIEIVEKYGAGTYSPGDLEDLEDKMKQCEEWIKKSKQNINKSGIF
ncbi:MAG: hypothetical protein PHQ52_01085 [Candidatus Omnitrophica bacterium]|jgi:hypothetical protein|nr:hypothetical protein [Candidatus Omnitrophota bacterium]